MVWSIMDYMDVVHYDLKIPSMGSIFVSSRDVVISGGFSTQTLGFLSEVQT